MCRCARVCCANTDCESARLLDLEALASFSLSGRPTTHCERARPLYTPTHPRTPTHTHTPHARHKSTPTHQTQNRYTYTPNTKSTSTHHKFHTHTPTHRKQNPHITPRTQHKQTHRQTPNTKFSRTNAGNHTRNTKRCTNRFETLVQEVLTPQRIEDLKFPVADGTAKLLGRDHEFRETTLSREPTDRPQGAKISGELQGATRRVSTDRNN